MYLFYINKSRVRVLYSARQTHAAISVRWPTGREHVCNRGEHRAVSLYHNQLPPPPPPPSAHATAAAGGGQLFETVVQTVLREAYQ